MKINEITDDPAGILKLIRKDCKPFLQKIGNKIGTFVMYRGMEDIYSDPLVRKKVRLVDRRPMSSAALKHERYNQYFEDTFGQPFRNSLHATGSQDMAEFYGDVFVIFPIGKFDWLWSSMVEDMAIDIRWPMVGGHLNVPPSQEAVEDELNSLNYNMNSDLKGAIVSGNEIMIRCKEYYALELSHFSKITM